MNVTALTNTHNTSPRKVAIRYIAIHYTAGTTSKKGSARNTARWFASPKNKYGSADYIVDDAEVVRYNPNCKTRYCWAVGALTKAKTKGGKWWGKCSNRNSISVEICSSLAEGFAYPQKANSKGWFFTDEVVQNAVELVKELMRIYNVPASNVIRHYDVTGKLCPGVIGWNEDTGDVSAWQQFKKAIAGEI